MSEPITRISSNKSPLKGKGGLIAVAAVAVLGIWLFIDMKKPVRQPDTEPPVSDFVHLTAEDVTRAELKRPEGGFTLAKHGDKWSFEAPGKYRANPESVTNWLKATLDDATPSYTVQEKPADLAAIGMDKPQYELVLTGRGGDTRTLQLGNGFKASPTAETSLYYAREAKDGRLFMLPLSVSDNLRSKKPEDLRDKRLVEMPNDKDVRKIVLQRAAGTTEVDRQGEDKWQLVQPFQAPAEKFVVEGLTSTIKSAEADSFVPNPQADLSKYGLDKPSLTLQVTDKTGTHTVLFGNSTQVKKDTKYYALRQGENEVVLVGKTTYDSLDKKPADLRERKLVTLDKDKITFLEVRDGSGTTQLQKSGSNDWTIANPADPKQKKAKGDVVQRVLDAVTGSASKHVEEASKDLAKYGLDKPEITVTANEGTGTSQVVQIGKKAPDGNYYARGVANAVFELQSFAYADLNVKPAAFVDPMQGKK